jgi:hypothetical protein
MTKLLKSVNKERRTEAAEMTSLRESRGDIRMKTVREELNIFGTLCNVLGCEINLESVEERR